MNYIPLTQVCDFQGGSQPPKEQWIDHAEDGYIRMLQIRDFTQPDKDNIEYVRLTKTVKTCNEDDILIGRYGASVGKILTGLSGAYNVAIIKTIPDASKLTKRFLYHYLNSPYFQSFILSVGSRAAQAGFNKEDLSDAQIPQLSLKEQEYVTSRLDKIVDLIALRKQQLSKLDELVKSRFIEMFGDPTLNPFGWKIVNIAEVVGGKVTNGFFAKRDEYMDDGNVKVLGVANIVNRMYSNVKDLPRTNGTASDIQKFEVRYGDMLFCRSSLVAEGIGKASIVPHDVPPNTLFECHVIRLPLDLNKCVPEFMQVLSTTDYFRNQVIAQSKTATMTTIGQDGILKTMIILPPIEKQQQFLEFVNQTDKSKFEIQKSLEKLETLKKALMQKYFG